jgi:hypothetical protein
MMSGLVCGPDCPGTLLPKLPTMIGNWYSYKTVTVPPVLVTAPPVLVTAPPVLVNCATSAGHCATSAGQLRHQCWSTAPPVLVASPPVLVNCATYAGHRNCLRPTSNRIGPIHLFLSLSLSLCLCTAPIFIIDYLFPGAHLQHC